MKPGNGGGLNLAVSVPGELRPIIMAALARAQVNAEGLRDAIQEGPLSASLAFDVAESGELTIRGVSSVDVSEKDAKRYAAKQVTMKESDSGSSTGVYVLRRTTAVPSPCSAVTT